MGLSLQHIPILFLSSMTDKTFIGLDYVYLSNTAGVL